MPLGHALRSYLHGFAIRRPFSRRLRLNTDDILNESGRDSLLQRLEPVSVRHALQASLTFLAYCYGNRHGDARALLARMSQPTLRERYSRLFRETDLRKFLLGCFRNSVAHGRPADTTAALLVEFSRRFDDAAARLVPAAPPAVRRAEPVSLLRFEQAPLPRKLRLGLLVKKYYYGKDSRLHDLGPRFQTAFAPYGVDCAVFDPVHEAVELGPRDLILVDDQYVQRYHCARDPARKAAFLDGLRGLSPRLGLIEFDPWATAFDQVLKGPGEPYDFVWTMAPGIAQGGAIQGVPACLVPFPVGFPDLFERLRTTAPVENRLAPISFCGGVEEYNHSRYLWLLASHGFRAPFPYEVSRHAADALDVEESTYAYLTKLTAARACLSLTMRSTGRSIVVGRAFDALRAERLLVQEASEDAGAYLVPGEHFEEFGCVAELEDLCFRLRGRDPVFTSIARAGTEFFNAQYSDEAVLRHLATHL